MSEENVEQELIDYDPKLTDMDKSEVYALAIFKKRGCQGLQRIDDVMVYKICNLYMAGKTYEEIAIITKEKKELILYLSEKLGWFSSKMAYLNKLNNGMLNKIYKNKLEGMNFLTNIMAFNHKYYGDKINQYLMTGDDKIVENLDWKPLEKYVKAVECLNKMLPEDPKDPKDRKPFAEIHLHGDAEITSSGPNQIKVETPKAQLVSALAQFKRQNKQDEE